MEQDNTELLTKIVKNQEEILKNQVKLTKKIDLALKALNLVKVSEEEMKKIQIQQRENLNMAAKVSAQLDDIENKDANADKSIDEIFRTPQEVYGDVLGDDILGGMNQ